MVTTRDIPAAAQVNGQMCQSASPTNAHQSIAALLCVRLSELCPPEFDATQGVEVRVSRRRSFIPDVLVTTAEAADRRPHWFAPHEVVLAVEIVSPTSVSFDRVAKPALYAQAGIPAYWRVETEHGIEVSTYALDPTNEIYRDTGVFTDVVKTDQPWPIEFSIREITPRRLR